MRIIFGGRCRVEARGFGLDLGWNKTGWIDWRWRAAGLGYD